MRASASTAITTVCQVIGAGLQVQPLKPFRVRVAPTPLRATRSIGAPLDAIATFVLHLDVLAPPIAHHSAALIGPPVPATPPGLLVQRGIAFHAMHLLLIRAQTILGSKRAWSGLP
ncbi:MAG: hypothetical protein DMD60_00015 [Gemmatimonadetes bacterium]|nr:MAG: hypothetical protein DMD60_00015 [Gemmatimonadota bacterium]